MPSPFSASLGAIARAIRIGDSKLTRIARCTSFELKSSSLPLAGSAALATSPSTSPASLDQLLGGAGLGQVGDDHLVPLGAARQ